MSTEENANLKRELGLFAVFAIASGAMISSGLFVLPGLAFERTGPSVVVAYGLAALLYLPSLLAQAELASAMPASGGTYFSIERSLGPLAGTIAGFTSWFSIALKAAFAFVGLGTLTILVWPEAGEWGIRLSAALACCVFTALNLVSVKEAGRLQGFLVLALLLILVGFVGLGFGHVEAQNFTTFYRGGMDSLLAVTGMVFVSFGGLIKVVDIGGEVSNPRRNLPLGLFLAFCIVVALYLLAVFVVVGVLPADELSGSLTPLADAARGLAGTWGFVLVSAAAFLAYATTGNAGILTASRSPMAMSRDGLLPPALARTHPRFGTPVVAVIATGGAMITVLLLLDIEDLVKTASTMLLLSFLLTNVAVIVMPRSGMEGYRPSIRVPLNPWLPAAAAIAYAFLIAEMGRVPLMTTALFLLAAGTWYFIYVDRRIQRESAVVHLVNMILAKHIRRTGLEDELVQISLERDDVHQDRFDKIVADCPVLDIEGSIEARELFHRLADELADAAGLPPDKLYELFLERERESSTVIRSGLAIPHVICPGEGIFTMALVRCREGVTMDDLHEPIREAFVLIGSADQRNFHLKALVAVAHIVQEPGFDSRWKEARNAEQLRDIVLLSGRERMKS